MEIPQEIIAWFFTEAEKHLLEIQLVEVKGMENLLVDVIYKKEQRMKVMLLIERVDEFLHRQQQQHNSKK